MWKILLTAHQDRISGTKLQSYEYCVKAKPWHRQCKEAQISKTSTRENNGTTPSLVDIPQFKTTYVNLLRKKKKTDVRAIIHFTPRAAITTRHQESVKPRKIKQSLGNGKSLPPFINSKHETTATKKEEEEEEKTTEATYLFRKQKKPRKNGSAPPSINRMKTKKIKLIKIR